MDTRKPIFFSNSEHMFADHIKSQRPFLDLTVQIHQYLHACGRSKVIAWPEDFGKSMFLSMCAEFEDIHGDPDVFAGLSINTDSRYKNSAEFKQKKICYLS